MSRLLLIQCPVNPRLFQQAGASDIDLVPPTDNFHWCLVEHSAYGSDLRVQESGVGPISGIPFADEALVLLPTIDVRLIHTRVPLISGKKLEALLPTLAEPYLIDQRTPLRYQVLLPQAGAAAINRTIAVTSDSWMEWLADQLSPLPVRSISMIPDCLLLDNPQAEGARRTFLLNQVERFMLVSTRDGYDWGAGWIELQDSLDNSLAQEAADTQQEHFEWPWVAPRACAWLKEKTRINLILKPVAQPKKTRTQKRVRWQPKIEWGLWRKPFQLAALSCAVYLAGSAIYLGVLGISNWRWQKTTEETARQHLLNPIAANQPVLPAFIKQAAAKMHILGKDTPGDFVPMAGKLQLLLSNYPSGLLESVTYQTDGLRFTLRNMKGVPDPAKLERHARALDMAVISLGRNEYQLLPYAGLMGEGTRP